MGEINPSASIFKPSLTPTRINKCCFFSNQPSTSSLFLSFCSSSAVYFYHRGSTQVNREVLVTFCLLELRVPWNSQRWCNNYISTVAPLTGLRRGVWLKSTRLCDVDFTLTAFIRESATGHTNTLLSSHLKSINKPCCVRVVWGSEATLLEPPRVTKRCKKYEFLTCESFGFSVVFSRLASLKEN